jgi:hypothetical protein
MRSVSWVLIVMDRSKLTAIITGAISLILAIAYLMLVQLLDLRGEMIPAPIGDLSLQPITPIARFGIIAIVTNFSI